MNIDEAILDKPQAEPCAAPGMCVQSAGHLLELSLDWIVLRASENVHHLLGESHVTLIDEPLGKFVQSQALHDLRNLFSRLSGTTGICRAYHVRLTEDHEFVDVAFQLSGGRVLLEAVASDGQFGEAFGSIGGLIAGLSGASGQELLDGGARRLRALTGYDRVTLIYGDQRSDSSRGAFAEPARLTDDLPAMIADVECEAVPIFPRRHDDEALEDALFVSPGIDVLDQLRREGVRATLRVPFECDGIVGEFRCDSRTPRTPRFEVHAAAELFAQSFATRLEIDRLKAR